MGQGQTSGFGKSAWTDVKPTGRDLARIPAVLKHRQPMVIEHLSALTPRAIQTLTGLLTNKSGYIRLEAAKDILNRTGVGAARDGAIPLLF